MRYNEKMFNRQIGRNAQLLAEAVGRMATPEARYPHLRALLAVIEEARPEWAAADHRIGLFTHLVRELSGAEVDEAEVAAAVRARDAERELAATDFEAVADEADAPAAEDDRPAEG